MSPSSRSTALLMAKFYELHAGAKLPPPTALRQAQLWLRQATADELSAYAKGAAARGQMESRQLAGIEQALSAEGLARSRNQTMARPISRDAKPGTIDTPALGTEQIARPFAHPYFWAGFIHTGQ